MKKNYGTSTIFKITDEDGFLGALFVKDTESINPYCSEAYRIALLTIQGIIDNANMHLFGVKGDIPREVFALRLLERQSVKGSVKICIPYKTIQTEFILDGFRKDYNFDGFTVDDRFCLTLDEDEAKEREHLYDLRVSIDLSKKVAILEEFISSFKLENYCKVREYDASKVHALWKELNSIPPGILRVRFNNLDDMYTEISKNAFGFKGSTAFPTIVLLK